jgi:very-short-patch-repair endonuclease
MAKRSASIPPDGFEKEVSQRLQLIVCQEPRLASPPCGHPTGGGEGSVGKEVHRASSLEINQSVQDSENMSTVRNCIVENECRKIMKGQLFSEQTKIVEIGFSSLSTTNAPSTLEVSNENTEQFPSAGGVSAGRGGQTSEENSTPYIEVISARRSGKSPEGCDTPSVENHIPRNTKNFMSLPYNPRLKQRAKSLRKAGNLPEVLFWLQVKNKQFKGYDFDRQKIVGNYIVDFYCGNCNVVVEIDGSSHDNKQEYDAIRDSYLQAQGLTVIHIPVVDVLKNMYGVMKMLHDHPALQHPLSREK